RCLVRWKRRRELQRTVFPFPQSTLLRIQLAKRNEFGFKLPRPIVNVFSCSPLRPTSNPITALTLPASCAILRCLVPASFLLPFSVGGCAILLLPCHTL